MSVDMQKRHLRQMRKLWESEKNETIREIADCLHCGDSTAIRRFGLGLEYSPLGNAYTWTISAGGPGDSFIFYPREYNRGILKQVQYRFDYFNGSYNHILSGYDLRLLREVWLQLRLSGAVQKASLEGNYKRMKNMA